MQGRWPFIETLGYTMVLKMNAGVLLSEGIGLWRGWEPTTGSFRFKGGSYVTLVG